MRYILGLILFCLLSISASAATLSVRDYDVLEGTSAISIPLVLTPDTPNETVGAMNISFSIGEPADNISILDTPTQFVGSIWENGEYFGVTNTPSEYSIKSVVTMIEPSEVNANGEVITYSVLTRDLPIGRYDLNPNHIDSEGFGSSIDTGSLKFNSGTMRINPRPVVPEPQTILILIFVALSLSLGIITCRK